MRSNISKIKRLFRGLGAAMDHYRIYSKELNPFFRRLTQPYDDCAVLILVDRDSQWTIQACYQIDIHQGMDILREICDSGILRKQISPKYSLVSERVHPFLSIPSLTNTPFSLMWMWSVPHQPEMKVLMLHQVPHVVTEADLCHCEWYCRHIHDYDGSRHNGAADTDLVNVMVPLISMLEAKDRFTAGHSFKVAGYAAQLGMALGLPVNRIRHLYRGALLHDIGKVGITDEVLRKPGRLSPEEYHQIQLHPVIGAKMLEGSEELKLYRDIVLNHRERMDGKGYPNRLSGFDISLDARIVCIADSFDAMTSRRVYRAGMSKQQAISQLREHSVTQFDQVLIEIFISTVQETPIQTAPGLAAAPTWLKT